MKMGTIKKMRNRVPFRPFQIHFTTGEVLPVQHPKTMAMPNDDTNAFVVWVGSDWNLIEVDSVARVSMRTRAGKQPTK